jgi:hypothetical protein
VLDWAQSLLYNGLGRYDEALAAARRVAEYPHDLSTSNWGMVELIEGCGPSRNTRAGRGCSIALAEIARVSGTDWALGVAARSEALFVEDERAEECYGGRTTRSDSDGRRSRSH